ncbi:hypothetical protein ACFQ44_05785 [Levilactobacillus lanxiensis]|uniref:Uncharacterized protein n=1 Tax=Levilactobacillus lanxiensis TaxID=2799568 RepID=A0ABW4D327_9LACO|nr:hypothetical protein [Levilactobacillus lanxiensis]
MASDKNGHPLDMREWTKVVVETTEKHPKVVAEITANNFDVAKGFRVRLTPKYDD